MSLKGVHIAFIAVSLILCAGFGAWAIADWRESGESISMYLGVGSFLSGIVLAFYGVWFLKKLRSVSFV